MFLKNSLFNSLPELLNIFLKFLVGLVTAKFLGPENLGITAAIGLIYLYSVLLHFGAINGMYLKIYSFKKNSGSYKKLRQIYSSSSYIFVNIMLIISSVILLVILNIFYSFDYIVWIGIYANILIAFLYQYFQFAQSFDRINYNFKAISKVQIVDYTFKAILTIILVYYYGLVGFFIALFFGYLFGAIFANSFFKPSFKMIFSKNVIKKIIYLGFPLLLIGAVLTFFQSIDRWFILKSLGTTELGYFTIMFTFSSMILLLPIRILSVVIQYVREYYSKTKDIVNVHLGFIELIFIFISLNTILILISKEFIFYLLKYYLVEYRLSYSFINPMVTVSYFIGIFHILSAYFVIIDKKRYTLISISIAFIFAIIFNFIAVYFYNTLYSIAMATFFSGFLLFIIMFYFFVSKGGNRIKIFNLVFKFLVIAILLISIFVLLPIHFFNIGLNSSLIISLQSLIMVILVIISLIVYIKKLKIDSLRIILKR